MEDEKTRKPPLLESVEVLCLKQLMTLEGGTSFEQAAGGLSKPFGSLDQETLLAQVEFHLSNAIEKLKQNWHPEYNTFVYQLSKHFGNLDELVKFVVSTLERWRFEVRAQVESTMATGEVRVTPCPRVCPRCRGTMIAEGDWYGSYSTCLYCGYVHEPTAPPEPILDNLEDDMPKPPRRRTPSHGNMRL